jgi:hypothetical protein
MMRAVRRAGVQVGDGWLMTHRHIDGLVLLDSLALHSHRGAAWAQGAQAALRGRGRAALGRGPGAGAGVGWVSPGCAAPRSLLLKQGGGLGSGRGGGGGHGTGRELRPAAGLVLGWDGRGWGRGWGRGGCSARHCCWHHTPLRAVEDPAMGSRGCQQGQPSSDYEELQNG